MRTPGHSKPPHQGLLERNKENICHLTGGGAGMMKVPASPQRNFSINSVASTYSEFQVNSSSSFISNSQSGQRERELELKCVSSCINSYINIGVTGTMFY